MKVRSVLDVETGSFQGPNDVRQSKAAGSVRRHVVGTAKQRECRVGNGQVPTGRADAMELHQGIENVDDVLVIEDVEAAEQREALPLERQMECRACKAVINAKLNPKRTKRQLHEASVRRRVADLLLEGENETIDPKALFKRFGGKCFKSGKKLDIAKRRMWAIDHILPSKFLYPLTTANAALLSRDEL